MSINLTFKLLKLLFGNDKIIFLDGNAFSIKINDVDFNFCYDEIPKDGTYGDEIGLILRSDPPNRLVYCDLGHGKEWYNGQWDADSKSFIGDKFDVQSTFDNTIFFWDNDFVIGDNYSHKQISICHDTHIFSDKLIFDADYRYHEQCKVISIKSLNWILSNQWNVVKKSIIEKYFIIMQMEGIECGDVRMVIMQILCLLGYY